MAEPVLVVIFLRGGADALNLVSPTADPDYIAARPEALRVLRKGDGAGVALGDGLADVDFRLHPLAVDLGTLFHAGDLSLLHATGLREATRSHFDAEARIERAAEGAAAGGWLGRWLAHVRPGGPLPALAVGTSLPDSLRGSRAAVAPDLSELMLAPGNWLAPALRARLAAGFGVHPTLGPTIQELLSVSSLFQDRFWQADTGAMRSYAPSTPYPEDSDLSSPLLTVAQALKSGLGLRIATVDYGGWDTHAHQEGDFAARLSGLSRALMAFWRDLGPLQQDVSVVVQSEFGRRLRANDSGGTDHGRAGAMMVLGPQARGGRLLGRWPGLHNAALEEGADLAVTTDYRDVLAEVLTGHMGLTDTEAVFPGLRPQPPGLFG
ncbi:MAG: DUF1501 domain-containing protein [Rhodobacterales bacterium]|nr:DUF1501 domain-containing protein [Rhodobacterales bacterium]NCT11674.1 DUF1501 domain-containing protein [Rhodobacterales bacterium]